MAGKQLFRIEQKMNNMLRKLSFGQLCCFEINCSRQVKHHLQLISKLKPCVNNALINTVVAFTQNFISDDPLNTHRPDAVNQSNDMDLLAVVSHRKNHRTYFNNFRDQYIDDGIKRVSLSSSTACTSCSATKRSLRKGMLE
jgi:hypothetical protein